MKRVANILIAKYDPISRQLLQETLEKWGYQVQTKTNGADALTALLGEDAPLLAILDWMMPEHDGPEVCALLRKEAEATGRQVPYLILLTARANSEDCVLALDAGADDYVTTPFERGELRARIRVGFRIAELQRRLVERVTELEDAFARVKQLQGLLPICCYCKSIRKDDSYWLQVEEYITEHSDAVFSHGICPQCFEKVVKPELLKRGLPIPD